MTEEEIKKLPEAAKILYDRLFDTAYSEYGKQQRKMREMDVNRETMQ